MSKIETKLHSNTTSSKLKKKQYKENSLILDILLIGFGFFGLSSLPAEVAGMMPAPVIFCNFALEEFFDVFVVVVIILGIFPDFLHSADGSPGFRR
jgi:hypothetical protein